MRLETNVSKVPDMRLVYPAKGGFLFTVDEDEPVYFLQEGYALNPAGTDDHRYQVLLMPRGNVIATFWWDLGPAEDFLMVVDGESYRAPPYQQPILLEHKVAECRHMAEAGRMDDFSVQLLHSQVNESTLFEEYARLIEEDMYLVRNRSTFGPGGHIQRNGYSPTGARRQQEILNGI